MNALLLALALAAQAAAPAAPAEKTYKVADGKTEIVAVTGGKVKLTGPAEMTVSARSIKLLSGRLLVAMPRLKGRFTVRTAHAVAAVRGTEFYMEANADSTYLCVCEGTVATSAPGQKTGKAQPEAIAAAVEGKRHTARTLKLGADGKLVEEPAEMRGHADDEFPSLRAQ